MLNSLFKFKLLLFHISECNKTLPRLNSFSVDFWMGVLSGLIPQDQFKLFHNSHAKSYEKTFKMIKNRKIIKMNR